MAGTNLLRWFLGVVWDEETPGKQIATSIALAAGLTAALLFRDCDPSSIGGALIVGLVVAIIAFSVARIAATATHVAWVESRERRRRKNKMMRLFENLGWEEKVAIHGCVFRGTSV